MSAKNARARERRISLTPPWRVNEVLEGSSEVISKVRRKKELMEGPVLFSCEGQAPAPSKDFCSIVISKKGVLWRKWKVSLRGMTSGSAPLPQPIEECLSHLDFRCDDSLVSEVKRVFGPETYSHIECIVSGCRDFLTCMPEEGMLKIALHLDLQSIMNLSYTNRFMHKFCNSNTLWSELYATHHVPPTIEITELANHISWKKIFYMSKLQLQKELSRRRKHHVSA